MTLSGAGPGPARLFNGKLIEPPPGRHWAWSQEHINEGLARGKIVFTSTGQPNIKQYLDDMEGSPILSIWEDIPPVNPASKELIGYNTQKPEALLERIIKASSSKTSIVADFFSGSGTMAAVAERLGRQWIAADLGKPACMITRRRLIDQDAGRSGRLQTHFPGVEKPNTIESKLGEGSACSFVASFCQSRWHSSPRRARGRTAAQRMPDSPPDVGQRRFIRQKRHSACLNVVRL